VAIDADRTGLLVPSHQSVVGDVAPDQAACVAKPRGPFTPAHARREPLDAGVEEAVFVEARIQALDGWIGIALARLPPSERSACKRRRDGSARRAKQVAPGHLHRKSPGCRPRSAMIVIDLIISSARLAHAARSRRRGDHTQCRLLRALRRDWRPTSMGPAAACPLLAESSDRLDV